MNTNMNQALNIVAMHEEGQTIKALRREKANLDEFSELTGEMYQASYRAAFLSALFLPSVQLISAVALAIIVLRGGQLAQVGGEVLDRSGGHTGRGVCGHAVPARGAPGRAGWPVASRCAASACAAWPTSWATASRLSTHTRPSLSLSRRIRVLRTA